MLKINVYAAVLVLVFFGSLCSLGYEDKGSLSNRQYRFGLSSSSHLVVLQV